MTLIILFLWTHPIFYGMTFTFFILYFTFCYFLVIFSFSFWSSWTFCPTAVILQSKVSIELVFKYHLPMLFISVIPCSNYFILILILFWVLLTISAIVYLNLLKSLILVSLMSLSEEQTGWCILSLFGHKFFCSFHLVFCTFSLLFFSVLAVLKDESLLLYSL